MRLSARGLLLALGSLMLTANLASAQWEAGRKFIGPRIGLSGVGSAPAFGGAFEVARDDRIGIGGFIDYWSFDLSPFDGGTSATYISFGATGSYHFEVSDSKWDPFVGLALGYFVVSFDNDFADVSGSRLFLGGQGGVRYFFKENTAFVARAGFGASYLSIGLDFGF